jgi:DNA-binding PadR family transcriptional regulator
MDDASLEEAILLALRRSPGSRAHALADAVGLPRTNFGRRLESRLQQPLRRLLDAGLIDEDSARYDLTQAGRRRLAARAAARQHRDARRRASESYPGQSQVDLAGLMGRESTEE